MFRMRIPQMEEDTHTRQTQNYTPRRSGTLHYSFVFYATLKLSNVLWVAGQFRNPEIRSIPPRISRSSYPRILYHTHSTSIRRARDTFPKVYSSDRLKWTPWSEMTKPSTSCTRTSFFRKKTPFRFPPLSPRISPTKRGRASSSLRISLSDPFFCDFVGSKQNSRYT